MCRWEFKLVFCAELKKLMSCVKIRLTVFLLFANQREEAREVELERAKHTQNSIKLSQVGF